MRPRVRREMVEARLASCGSACWVREERGGRWRRWWAWWCRGVGLRARELDSSLRVRVSWTPHCNCGLVSDLRTRGRCNH